MRHGVAVRARHETFGAIDRCFCASRWDSGRVWSHDGLTSMRQKRRAGRRLHFRRTRRGNVNYTGPLSGPIALAVDI